VPPYISPKLDKDSAEEAAKAVPKFAREVCGHRGGVCASCACGRVACFWNDGKLTGVSPSLPSLTEDGIAKETSTYVMASLLDVLQIFPPHN